MYEREMAAKQAGNVTGSVYATHSGAADVRPAPMIEGLTAQIESRISGLFDMSNRVDAAINRLLNPQPEGVNKAQETPQPQTIEARLSNIVRMLDGLQSRYSAQGERLDGAV